MTLISGSISNSRGSAVRPSITGISMSRRTTSMVGSFSRDFRAREPSPTDATTNISVSASRILVTRPLITAESSTIITRMGGSAAVPAVDELEVLLGVDILGAFFLCVKEGPLG